MGSHQATKHTEWHDFTDLFSEFNFARNLTEFFTCENGVKIDSKYVCNDKLDCRWTRPININDVSDEAHCSKFPISLRENLEFSLELNWKSRHFCSHERLFLRQLNPNLIILRHTSLNIQACQSPTGWHCFSSFIKNNWGFSFNFHKKSVKCLDFSLNLFTFFRLSRMLDARYSRKM